MSADVWNIKPNSVKIYSGPNATRECQKEGQWNNPDLTVCVRQDLQESLDKVSAHNFLFIKEV